MRLKLQIIGALLLSCSLSACGGGSQNSLAPTRSPQSLVHVPTASQLVDRAKLPAGTRIFYVGNTAVTDGTKQSVFPSSAIVTRSAIGVSVSTGGKIYSFSASANVQTFGAGEFYAPPGTAVPRFLQNVQPNEVIGGTPQVGVTPQECFDQESVGRRSPQDCDDNSNGGDMDTTRLNGVMTSFSADSDSFTFSFDNSVGSSSSYTYSYQLSNSTAGYPVYNSGPISGSIVGPSGEVYSQTPSQFAGGYDTITVSITVNSGSANGLTSAPGNAGATYNPHH